MLSVALYLMRQHYGMIVHAGPRALTCGSIARSASYGPVGRAHNATAATFNRINSTYAINGSINATKSSNHATGRGPIHAVAR